MEIVKRAIRLMHEGKCIYDQFQLDEDYNVPDAKEDVGNVIEGTVCVKTEDMKLVENYLKIRKSSVKRSTAKNHKYAFGITL